MMKLLTSGIILLLLASTSFTFASPPQLKTQGSRIIIVPDDYSTIQKAINVASSGDTIYVRAGIYYENLFINKGISLIGEGPSNTIIDGAESVCVVAIVANHSTIKGFTLRNGFRGIKLSGFNNTLLGTYNVTATYGGSQGTCRFEVIVFRKGLLRVQTIPAVVTTIRIDGIPRNDWGLDWVKIPEGNYALSFTDVPGFITPDHVDVTFYPPGGPPIKIPLNGSIPVYADVTTEVKVYFIHAGYLKVETHPWYVNATIFVNGRPANDYGVHVTLKPGNYMVSFQEAPSGFLTPPPITVPVIAGRHTMVIGNYTSGESYVKEIKAG